MPSPRSSSSYPPAAIPIVNTMTTELLILHAPPPTPSPEHPNFLLLVLLLAGGDPPPVLARSELAVVFSLLLSHGQPIPSSAEGPQAMHSMVLTFMYIVYWNSVNRVAMLASVLLAVALSFVCIRHGIEHNRGSRLLAGTARDTEPCRRQVSQCKGPPCRHGMVAVTQPGSFR
jgi:hypothetical protein